VSALAGVYVDLLRYRELFSNLFQRELRVKYKGSVLGIVWSLANPLVLMGIYVLVFSTLWHVTSGIDHYPLYLLTGLAVWVFFAGSLQTASRSMLDSAELIKKVRFPRQLVAFSVVATQLVTFAVMFCVLFVVNLALLPRTREEIWLALPIAAALVALVAGVSLAVASLNVVFRDVEHLVSAVLLPWFFLTPVLWSFDQFHSHHRLEQVIRYANFVTPPISALRDPLFFGRLPRAVDVVYLCVAAAAALALGAFVFSRVDDRIAVEL
jgi:ABC-type polysaccharide/polyol phosphate export permease